MQVLNVSSNNTNLFSEFLQHKSQKTEVGSGSVSNDTLTKRYKKDIYTETPVRYLGFANEVGAAVAPLLGHITEMITYAPALGYIAMDVRDKFKRGDDNSYQQTSQKRATKQLVFQMMASVILPTAAVKAGQVVAGKTIDKMPNVKNKIKSFVAERKTLANLIDKCKDKHSGAGTKLDKFAHGFQKIIDVFSVIPLFIKTPPNKSGLRNIGLAVVGLTALGAAIKPIDYFTEHVIIGKGVDRVLYKKSGNNETAEKNQA